MHVYCIYTHYPTTIRRHRSMDIQIHKQQHFNRLAKSLITRATSYPDIGSHELQQC